MKLYLDLFFFVNMALNFSVFLLESFFQNRKVKVIRILIASAMGAFAALLFVVLKIGRMTVMAFLFFSAISVLLVRLAFGKTTVRAWIRNVVIYYICAFLLSGLLYYLQNAFHAQGSSLLLFGGTGICLYIAYLFLPMGRKRWEHQQNIVPFSLCFGEKEICGKGLIDTGNRLQEPFSGEPVIVGSKLFLQDLLLSEEILYRYIPYHSIGKDQGMIPAFRADSLEITEAANKKKILKPWIAIHDSEISADGEYEIILNPDIFVS